MKHTRLRHNKRLPISKFWFFSTLVAILLACLYLYLLKQKQSLVSIPNYKPDKTSPSMSEDQLIGQTIYIALTSDGIVPWTVTIKKGTKVTWRNDTPQKYQIIGEGFKSDSLGQNDTFSRTFNQIGTHNYRVGNVAGTIIVQ